MSLTLAEARVRAALVSDVSYDLTLDLTGRSDYACRTTIRFACADEGAETFLELAHASEVLVDGLPATTYDGRRIRLGDLRATNEVTVEACIPYVTDGDGMHTFTDPADGETYVGAFVGMDLCQRIFPCFDQNDLKAPVTLTVQAPAGWSVVANGRLAEQADGVWRFGTTPPIPLPMFTVCAGPWHSVRWSTPGPTVRSCRSPGTPALPSPASSTATPTSSGRSPRTATTSTSGCSASRSRSAASTRSSCRA